MISNVKFNELAGRVEHLAGKVEDLDNCIKAQRLDDREVRHA